jgi:general stress protein 26
LLSELDRDCDIVPPLPIPLMRLLSLSEVCQLATVRPDQTPHLCLMRFTYAEGLLILTTQRDTEKFGNLQANPHVAAIFHDIKSVSVTVYGRLREEDDPERAERLRALHAKKNPAYLQFIVGDGIAVMSVDITRVRICNIDDKVTNWEKGMKV